MVENRQGEGQASTSNGYLDELVEHQDCTLGKLYGGGKYMALGSLCMYDYVVWHSRSVYNFMTCAGGR